MSLQIRCHASHSTFDLPPPAAPAASTPALASPPSTRFQLN